MSLKEELCADVVKNKLNGTVTSKRLSFWLFFFFLHVAVSFLICLLGKVRSLEHSPALQPVAIAFLLEGVEDGGLLSDAAHDSDSQSLVGFFFITHTRFYISCPFNRRVSPHFSASS